MKNSWHLDVGVACLFFAPLASSAFADESLNCSYPESNRAYRCDNGSVVQFIAAGPSCPEQTTDLAIPCTNPQTGETMSWPAPDEAGCIWRTGTFCSGRSKMRFRCRDNSCRATRYDFAGWVADTSPGGLIDGCFQTTVEEVSADCGGGTDASAATGVPVTQPSGRPVVDIALISNSDYHYAPATVARATTKAGTVNPYSGLSVSLKDGVVNGPPTGSNTPTLAGGNPNGPSLSGFVNDYLHNLFDTVYARNADLIHSRDVHDNPADAAYEHTVIMNDVLSQITQDLPSLVAAGVDAALGTAATIASNITGAVMGLIQANTGIEAANLDFAGHMVLAAVAYSSGDITEGNRQSALAAADLQGDVAGTEAAINGAATRSQTTTPTTTPNTSDQHSENETNTTVAQNDTTTGNQSGDGTDGSNGNDGSSGQQGGDSGGDTSGSNSGSDTNGASSDDDNTGGGGIDVGMPDSYIPNTKYK